MKLGLIGGTFNPIHTGHLIISEYMRTSFMLDKVIFIPSGIPPHKVSLDMVSSEHRKAMVTLATESNQYFEVSALETNRSGKSYTIDTIKEFNELYPNDDLFFIIGADSLFELTTWKEFKVFSTMTSFILSGRPGISEDKILRKIDELKNLYNTGIIYIKGPLVEISSSLIRERVKENKSIKYLVPERVESYIYTNNLYKSEV